jgi:hypothetical protein
VSDALTVGGFVVGVLSLGLTWLIFQWTNKTDDEHQTELLDAVHDIAELLPQGQPSANLSQLSQPEQVKLLAALQQGESVVHVARSATGKGNHPWRAITNQGRVFHIYTGGRLGGVHVKELT